MEQWRILLGILSLLYSSADAFVPRPPLISSKSKTFHPSVPALYHQTSSRLQAKLWDRLEIEEDEEPHWYLLNCIAGLELDLLKQCREKCGDMPDALKFVVPTEKKTRSHGANRMVTETKVKYQGYVFAKLRLCPQVYEAIQGLDLCRSWMGTVNHKGYKKLPPAPVALNEMEVENFGLEEEDFEDEEEDEDEDDSVIVDSGDDEPLVVKDPVDEEALKEYLGLKVEDMIKVTAKNKFYNEDGIIRRLKEGKILARFYTYGTMFEEWLDPSDVRKLDGEEILKGLGGPSRPITQRDFDEPQDQDNRDWSEKRGGGLRQGLMGSVKGARGPRNTRRDRAARGDAGYTRDMFGRTEEEKRREERNWKWYQEKQRNQDGRGQVSGQVDEEWNFRGQSRQNRDDDGDYALRDVDSQWGRQSQRQRRKEQRPQNTPETRRVQNAVEGNDDWSAFVSPASEKSEDDDFFASLMSDLSDDLDDSASSTRPQSKKSQQDEDDFFASLMSELSDDEKGNTAAGKKEPGRKVSNAGEDDFFAALEAELGNAFEGKEASYSDGGNDFFAKLEAEMNPNRGRKSETTDESEISDFVGIPEAPDTSLSVGSIKVDFSRKADKTASPSKSSSPGDLHNMKVPELKEMLRERGLKVSGKKSELIDRLTQGQN